MPKSDIQKRVKFLDQNEQKEFIELIKTRIRNGAVGIAKISGVSVRQISDWKNAKSTLPVRVFEKLLVLAKIPRPKNIKIVGRYAHTKSAGMKGFIAIIKKYGEFPKNEKVRKENWWKWWKSKGKYQDREIFKRKFIKTPERNTDLAELCGIIIGDGGITRRQVKITLNCETDRIYSEYVMKLLTKLFDVKPSIHNIRGSKALNICISRSDLVDFLVKQGLKLGNKLKQNVSIPQWIMKSQKYVFPCVRGMMDTDGCVVLEIHRIKNKNYTYCRLNFTSASPALVDQVVHVLETAGFHPKIRRGGRSVQLEKIDEIWEYFQRIGTSNPKHIDRLRRSGSRGLRHRS